MQFESMNTSEDQNTETADNGTDSPFEPFESSFAKASEMDEAGRDELLKEVADDHHEDFDEILSLYLMWEGQRSRENAHGDDTWESLLQEFEACTNIDKTVPILQRLIEIRPNEIQKKKAFDIICDRSGWRPPTDCIKKLNKEFNDQKKKRQREQAREKSARSKDDRHHRRTYFNYKNEPFASHVGNVIRHFISSNANDPHVFQYGVDLVSLHKHGKTGLKQIVPCKVENLRAELSQQADWCVKAYDPGEDDEDPFKTKYEACPLDVAKHIASVETSTLGLPLLNGLKFAPFFDANGNIIQSEGYHNESGFYLSLEPGFVVPPVSDKPSPEEIEKAKHLLSYEVYGDFPFNDGEQFPDGWHTAKDENLKLSVGKASRANQIAKTLQPFCEQMIQGHLPLHAVDKPAPRTGSQFLAQALGIITMGTAPAMRPAPKSDEEWQKTILTAAYEAVPYLVFDNVKNKLESDALASAITSGTIAGRDLGRNRQISGENRGIIEVNGNNLEFDKDLSERVLLVRLDANMKDPGTRRDFRHASLATWCRQNRPDLVWACLTIIQNWIAKGKPQMSDNARVLAGFEEYYRIIGGILETAGIEGFNANRALIKREDTLDEMQGFVTEWLTIFGTDEVAVGNCERGSEADPHRRRETKAVTLVEMLLDMSHEITLGLFDNPNRASLSSRLSRFLGTKRALIYEIDNGVYKLYSRTLTGKTMYRLAPAKGTAERARGAPGSIRMDIPESLSDF